MPLNADGSLQGDQYGFLILGHARLENGISHVYGDTQDILRLLRQNDADNPLNAPISQLTEVIRDLSQTRRTRAPRRATGGAANGGNPPSIVLDAPELPIVRDAANSDTAPRPARRGADGRFRSGNDAQDGQSGDSRRTGQRDANGRFVGGGDSPDNPILKALGGIRDTLRINADASHVDPTIDAIRELGGMFAPVAKVGKLSLRGAKWLFGKVKKAPPPSEQEQRQLNRIERLLKGVRDGLNKPSNEMMLALAAAAGAASFMSMFNPADKDKPPETTGEKAADTVRAVLGNEDAKKRIENTDANQQNKLWSGIPKKPVSEMDWSERRHTIMAAIGSEDSRQWLLKNRPDNVGGYDKPEDWYIANRVPMPSRGNSNTGLPVAPVSGGGAAAAQGGKGRYADLANAIGMGEGDYNSIHRGVSKKTGQDFGSTTTDLSNMTINEVLKRNTLKFGDPKRMNAVGKYQIIATTLQGLKQNNGLSGEEKLTPEMQDKLFGMLMPQATRDYISGKSSNKNSAMVGLAETYASIGVPMDMMRISKEFGNRQLSAGDSFYKGVGKNKANPKATAAAAAALDRLRMATPPKPTTPVAAPAKVAAPEVNTAPAAKPQPAKPAQPQVSSMNKVSTPKPQVVTIAPDNSMIAQNVSDRALAHAITGGLGMERFVG